MKKVFLSFLFICASISVIWASNENTAVKSITPMTPEILLSLKRLSNQQLSPDGVHYLYRVSIPNIADNNIKGEYVLGNLKSGERHVILPSELKASEVTFVGNDKLAYIGKDNKLRALFLLDINSGTKTKLSDFDFDIQGYKFSPDYTHVVIIRNIPLPNPVTERYKDLDKSSGRIITNMMYKHWDEWVESVPKPYIASVGADYKVSKTLTPVLSENEYYEVPIKPFSGVEQLDWSTDGKILAYSCKKKTGLAYALSTNTDIYLYNLDTKETKNISEGMMGYDTDPSFSPDGKSIAWLSMERDGYESDVRRLFVMDLNTGKREWVTKGYENNVDQFIWRADAKAIRFVSCVEALTNIYELNLSNDHISAITAGVHNVTSFSGNKDVLICGIQSFIHPTDLYKVDLTKQSNNLSKLTDENDAVLSKVQFASVKKCMVKTTDNKEMLTWLILPPHFDKNKKYPAVLYCQGGPQSTVSQFWSYRWNLNTFASAGFIIVAPNRRGLPSFGKEWLEQISGDYGGQNMKDYLSAIDYAATLPYVDKAHLGCTGASYGGFSTYWLAGHHDKRFKAFFAHAGIFNLEAQYLETEELFFANWDMGGNYWDKSNKVAQRTYATSPHLFVDKWDTPIMISAGEKDYRILASQGMMAFDAAMLNGVPTEMLLFPDENHWILQPQNGLLFYRSWIRWMDRWLVPKNR